MNNTEKLDSVRCALRRIETQVGIIQRTNVIIFERITGGAFPHSWIIHDEEQAILSENGPISNEQLSTQIEEYTGATNESLKMLMEWITRIETRLTTGKHEAITPAAEK
jgi:hypothetical protein